MIDVLRAKYGETETDNSNSALASIYRSVKPTYFVFYDKSPSSKCHLTYVREGWNAGLIDSCTGHKYDFSGRSNFGQALEIPEYTFISETKIVFDE